MALCEIKLTVFNMSDNVHSIVVALEFGNFTGFKWTTVMFALTMRLRMGITNFFLLDHSPFFPLSRLHPEGGQLIHHLREKTALSLSPTFHSSQSGQRCRPSDYSSFQPAQGIINFRMYGEAAQPSKRDMS